MRLRSQPSLAAMLLCAGSAASAPSWAGEAVVCRVPHNVVCEGCATNLRLSLDRDGRCRISFTPGPYSSGAEAGFVTILVDPNLWRAAAGVEEERPAPRRFRRPAAAARENNGPAPSRCFTYNGQAFC